LLPFSPDFRWDADWYKSIKQYRQKENGNWTTVLNSVRNELLERFKSRGNKIQDERIDIWLWEAQMNLQFNDVSAAIDRYMDVLRLDPLHDKASIDLFMIYHGRHEYEKALMTLEKRLELAPNSAVCCNAGICYDLLGDKEKALELYDQGIRLNPNEFFIFNNRAAIKRRFDAYQSGIEDAVRATTINPNFAPAYSNKAVLHFDLKEYDQAEEDCLKALSIDPTIPDANFSLSQIYFKQGRYYEGFKQYEFRLNFDTYKQGNGLENDKKWNGEDLDGKKIMIVDEQGAGDTILFSRYIPLLIERGAEIIVATTTDVFSLLRPLGVSFFKELKKGKKGTKTFVRETTDEPYDYFCFMASLPLMFKTTTKKIPSPGGYLISDKEKTQKWSEILGPKTKPRIGIVWSGGEEFLTDWRRSMTLEQFVNCLPEGYEYVCLQKTVRKADEVSILNYPWIKFIGNQLDDFSDTAAVIDNVDLVISTCTSAINLAGALGKESWVLLPFNPDWRWDAEWYSNVKQYRQKTPHNTTDWSEVLAEVKADLQAKYMHESS
jgi:tetratricopeptide (TPR) repeat protein